MEKNSVRKTTILTSLFLLITTLSFYTHTSKRNWKNIRKRRMQHEQNYMQLQKFLTFNMNNYIKFLRKGYQDKSAGKNINDAITSLIEKRHFKTIIRLIEDAGTAPTIKKYLIKRLTHDIEEIVYYCAPKIIVKFLQMPEIPYEMKEKIIENIHGEELIKINEKNDFTPEISLCIQSKIVEDGTINLEIKEREIDNFFDEFDEQERIRKQEEAFSKMNAHKNARSNKTEKSDFFYSKKKTQEKQKRPKPPSYSWLNESQDDNKVSINLDDLDNLFLDSDSDGNFSD